MEKLINDTKFMGYVNYVNPQYFQVHLPSFKVLELEDELTSLEKVKIGDFLVVEGAKYHYLAKILEINTPKQESAKFSDDDLDKTNIQLSVKAEILVGFDPYEGGKLSKGMACYPSIGDKAYYSDSIITEHFLSEFGLKYNTGYSHLALGVTTDMHETEVSVSLQSLFGRHCAIVGTTGGGKSWTVARLIGEMRRLGKNKMILIDPTGEYKSIEDDAFTSVSVANDTFFHYRNLTIEDLYYLIKPSGNIQMPKLLDAIRSLKAVDLDQEDVLYEYKKNGILRKSSRKKETFENFYFDNIDAIEDGRLNFNINCLSAQITQECIFDTDKNHPEKYGIRNEEAVSRCFNLISRTSNLLHTEVFKKAFGFDENLHSPKELTKIIDEFLSSDKHVLRIGFEGIGFEFQAREIIANAIGKFLLLKARDEQFVKNPTIVFVDEAHQFMNKTVVDDYFKGSSLTSFDQIAKECRKYGLFLCLATQMPRDIPVGTLSQIGTFIVHRLINRNDKEAIIEACASATDNTLAFLPVLGEGEAILTGVDFPMDLILRVIPPRLKPMSGTPELGTDFEF